jgi:hypothetical protein
MTNLNTAIRYDPAASQNPRLVDWSKQYCDTDNAEFFAAVARAPGNAGTAACIVLTGEYSVCGYRLRRAQEVIRVDRTPSPWSHAFVLLEDLSRDAAQNRDPAKSALLLESTLQPNPQFDHFSFRTGVSGRRIADYAGATFDLRAAHCVPNVAVISIALSDQERTALLARAKNPEADQLGYDLLGQLASWFTYIASRGTALNPLAQGVAMFSASYVQLAYDAAGIDVAPGAQQRNLAPEHFWQASRYLHARFQTMDQDGKSTTRAVSGFFCVRDRACVMAPVDAELPRTFADLLPLQPMAAGGGTRSGGSEGMGPESAGTGAAGSRAAGAGPAAAGSTGAGAAGAAGMGTAGTGSASTGSGGAGSTGAGASGAGSTGSGIAGTGSTDTTGPGSAGPGAGSSPRKP